MLQGKVSLYRCAVSLLHGESLTQLCPYYVNRTIESRTVTRMSSDKRERVVAEKVFQYHRLILCSRISRLTSSIAGEHYRTRLPEMITKEKLLLYPRHIYKTPPTEL